MTVAIAINIRSLLGPIPLMVAQLRDIRFIKDHQRHHWQSGGFSVAEVLPAVVVGTLQLTFRLFRSHRFS